MKLTIQKTFGAWELKIEDESDDYPSKVYSTVYTKADSKTEVLAKALDESKKLETLAKEIREELKNF